MQAQSSLVTHYYLHPVCTLRSERLAKRYWDKLFKEYCLVDLSRYKEDKVSSSNANTQEDDVSHAVCNYYADMTAVW